jgi:hypothetical protein
MQTVLKHWVLSDEVKIDLSPSTKNVAPMNDEDDSQQAVLDEVKKANRDDSEEMVQVRDLGKDDKTGYEIRSGFTYSDGRLYVPEENDLRTKLLEHIHCQPSVGPLLLSRHVYRRRTLSKELP